MLSYKLDIRQWILMGKENSYKLRYKYLVADLNFVTVGLRGELSPYF